MPETVSPQHPADGSVIGGPTEDLSPKSPAQLELEVTPKKEPLYKGFSGEINTPQELVDYAKTLEARLVEANLRQPPSVNQPTFGGSETQPASTPTIKEEDPALLIYTDPKKAMDLHERKILEKIEQKKNQEAAQKKFFEDLYEESPDLRSVEPIVKSTLAAKWNEIAPMSFPDARKFLAKESRKMVDLVKSQHGVKTTELESRPAVNLGASGQPAPRIPVSKEEAPKSLIDDLKDLRAKRRKSA
jgi:hypothetical protein